MDIFSILAADSGANSDELLQYKPNPIHVKYRYRVYERVGGLERTCGGGGHWHAGVLEYCATHDVYYMEIRETLRLDMRQDPHPKICSGQRFKLKVLPHEEVLAKSVKQRLKTMFKRKGVFWVAIKDLDTSCLEITGGCGALENQFVKEGKRVYVQVNPAFVQGPCDLKCLNCNRF